MKKLIFSIFAMFAALSMSAANTASANITITGATTGSDKLRIAENVQFSAAFDNGYDAPQPDANIPGIYAMCGTMRLTDCVSNNVDGLVIGVVAGADESYTLSFANVAGGYKLVDLVAGQISDMTSDYTFTMTANSRDDQRFVLMKTVTFEVTTNVNGWATYSNSLDLVAEAAPAGVTEPIIYSAEYDGVETLTLTAQDGVKANTGVVVWGDPSTTYTLVPGTVMTYTSGLTASVAETTVDAAKTNYCLATINGVSAFYEYTGAKVSANKAYLEVGGTAAPKRIRMVVNGTTDVENVEAEVTTEKVYLDGQLLIKKGDQLYNLQGQIVK